jgi:hypothetical protein
MLENRWWMYDDWNKSRAHSAEWIAKTKDVINRAISQLSLSSSVHVESVRMQSYLTCSQLVNTSVTILYLVL